MPTAKESLRAELNHSRAELLALATSLTSAEWSRRTSDGWSVVEELCHIADSEQGLRTLIRLARLGLPIRLPSFGVHLRNRLLVRSHRTRTLSDALTRLEHERERTLTQLDALGASDLNKRIYRPLGGATTIELAFRRIVEHEREHMQAITQALSQAEKR